MYLKVGNDCAFLASAEGNALTEILDVGGSSPIYGSAGDSQMAAPCMARLVTIVFDSNEFLVCFTVASIAMVLLEYCFSTMGRLFDCNKLYESLSNVEHQSKLSIFNFIFDNDGEAYEIFDNYR